MYFSVIVKDPKDDILTPQWDLLRCNVSLCLEAQGL